MSFIIRQEPLSSERYYAEDVRKYNLAAANHEKSYQKLIRHLLKNHVNLHIATSGYTSEKLQLQESVEKEKRHEVQES
jgi:hypothetical protein